MSPNFRNIVSSAPGTGDKQSRSACDVGRVLQLLNTFTRSAISIRIHSGEPHDSPILEPEVVKDKLRNAQMVARETILDALEIKEDDKVQTRAIIPAILFDKRRFDIQALLNSKDESKCQGALTRICKYKNSRLIDCHDGKKYSCGTSKDMTGVDEEHLTNVFPLNGKIDLVSAEGPLFLEIKGRLSSESSEKMTSQEYKIMLQVLERIYHFRCCHGQVSKIVCFSATSTDARCYVYRRSNDDISLETLDIWSINHDDIFKLWNSVATVMSQSSRWFLTRDAPYINSSLMRLGYHPSICGVKLEKSSSRSRHHVYHVHLPKFCQFHTGPCVLGIPRGKNVICIKVHNPNDE